MYLWTKLVFCSSSRWSLLLNHFLCSVVCGDLTRPCISRFNKCTKMTNKWEISDKEPLTRKSGDKVFIRTRTGRHGLIALRGGTSSVSKGYKARDSPTGSRALRKPASEQSHNQLPLGLCSPVSPGITFRLDKSSAHVSSPVLKFSVDAESVCALFCSEGGTEGMFSWSLPCRIYSVQIL